MFTGGQRSREGGLGADVVSKAALDSYLNPTEDQEQMVLAEWSASGFAGHGET